MQPVVEFYIPESCACANSNTWTLHAHNLPMVETVSLEDKRNLCRVRQGNSTRVSCYRSNKFSILCICCYFLPVIQQHWYLSVLYDRLKSPPLQFENIKLSDRLTVLAGEDVLRAPSGVYHISWYPGANSCLMKDKLRDNLQENIVSFIDIQSGETATILLDDGGRIHGLKAAGNSWDKGVSPAAHSS